MKTVLVVEDEADVRDLLVLSLKREGFEVIAFDHAEDAIPVIAKVDLAVLDWMLPKMSGLELCKIIRASRGTHFPIMLLTARADTSDKVLGLDTGADDYLSKPFEMREFIARMRSLKRRLEGDLSRTTVLTCHGFRIDVDRKSVFQGTTEIPLTPNEFKLMHEFFKKPGFTYDRESLIRLIQGPNVAVVDRTIDTSILGLRKKLGTQADIIETVRGFGYRLKTADGPAVTSGTKNHG